MTHAQPSRTTRRAIMHVLLTMLALTVSACSTPRATPATTAWTTLSPTIRIDRTQGIVEFTATSVISVGFLETSVCTVGTREHESLFAFDGAASEIHAALLLAGFVPGTPGRWREVTAADGSFSVESVPPTGESVEVGVRLPDGQQFPVAHFVRAAPITDEAALLTPPTAMVFGGSRLRTDRRTGREIYLADASGSLIGLVTFGDETIGCVEVIPDQASVAAPIWEVFTERMPTPGTAVTIVVRRSTPTTSAATPEAKK